MDSARAFFEGFRSISPWFPGPSVPEPHRSRRRRSTSLSASRATCATRTSPTTPSSLRASLGFIRPVQRAPLAPLPPTTARGENCTKGRNHKDCDCPQALLRQERAPGEHGRLHHRRGRQGAPREPEQRLRIEGGCLRRETFVQRAARTFVCLPYDGYRRSAKRATYCVGQAAPERGPVLALTAIPPMHQPRRERTGG